MMRESSFEVGGSARNIARKGSGNNGSNLEDLDVEEDLEVDQAEGQRDFNNDGAVSIGDVGGPTKFRYIKNRKYMRRLYYVLAALAAIFVFSTLLRVAIRSNNNNNNNAAGEGTDMDLAGSSLREKHLLILMNDNLKETGGDIAGVPSTLNDANSPERKALRWIANDDPMQIEVPETLFDESYPAFLQRYSVAVLTFAWGEEILEPLGFLSGKSECEWNANFTRPDISIITMGIICDDGQPQKVQKIVLQTLGLSGVIPKEIGNLDAVTHVHLDANELGGELTPAFHRLHRLRELTATRNGLTGHLPGFIGSSTTLRHVELSFNKFDGELLSAFDVGIGDNADATDDLPSSNIEIFAVDHNDISGEIPDAMKRITDLKELYLNNNRLTSHIWDYLRGYDKLAILDASENQMQGHIPDYVLQMKNLHILDLHSNSFEGQFNHGNATTLRYLDVHDNKISNILPSSIGDHPNLAFLDISENNIIGLIPTEIARLKKLEYLFLAHNPTLDPAPLPEWLTDLPILTAVSFKDTSRIGELPAWLGQLSQLSMLDLESNSFNSTLPDQLHKMSSMEYLFLNRNALTGNVPSNIGNMTNLVLLNLDHNQLTGRIEDPICRMDLEVLVTDCLVSETRKDPVIECACCTKCCDPLIEQCNTRDWSKHYKRDWGGYYERYNIVNEGDVYKLIEEPGN